MAVAESIEATKAPPGWVCMNCMQHMTEPSAVLEHPAECLKNPHYLRGYGAAFARLVGERSLWQGWVGLDEDGKMFEPPHPFVLRRKDVKFGKPVRVAMVKLSYGGG